STWAVDWSMRRPTEGTEAIPDRPSKGQDRYLLADMAFLKAADQQKLAAQFQLTTLGQFILVDRGVPPGPAEAFSFDEREPTALEWYLVDGTEPVRSVRADPWATWEVRDEFGQTPNPLPDASPATAAEIRIAYNAAVEAGDPARAEALQARLLAKLDTHSSVKFTDGTVILGERLKHGAAPVLELYFLAAGPSPVPDRQFDIQSVVERALFGSLVEADPKVRLAGM